MLSQSGASPERAAKVRAMKDGFGEAFALADDVVVMAAELRCTEAGMLHGEKRHHEIEESPPTSK